MNIAVCTDENFVMPALVCLTSVFENNRGENVHAYVLTDGISVKAKGKFQQLSQTYKQPIDVMTIDRHVFDGLRVNERFPVSMYYRFLLPKMLPNEDKVLYLDCDIIVRQNLRYMYETNLGNKALAVVVAQSSDRIHWANMLHLSTQYFNSGVLLMNLNYWRENNIAMLLIQWVKDNPDKCDLPDQNALNKVLEGKADYLDYSYNYQDHWFGQSLTECMHFSKWPKIREAGNNPAIVHFCSAEKPWFVECRNPFQQEFIKYAKMHPFIGFRLMSRYGSFVWRCSVFIDRIGMKFRWWAERWQKHIVKAIKVS